MKAEGLISDLQRVRRVFPYTDFESSHGGWMTIQNYPLANQYNQRSTKILVKLFLGSPYNEPYIYVPTDLDLAYSHSHHLDFCTELEMREKEWKRICIKMDWRPEYCLLDVVHLAMDFLNNLRE